MPDIFQSLLASLRRVLKSSRVGTVLGGLYRELFPKSVRAQVISRDRTHWVRKMRDQYGERYGKCYRVEIHGEEIVFSTRDDPSLKWFATMFDSSIHEPSTTHLFARLARSADGIMDIGAHLGWFTCIGAALSKGSVYSFEMDEENVTRLRSNVELNDQLESVRIEQLAVTDGTGRVTYFKSLGAASPKHTLSTKKNGGNRRVEVSSTSVDAYCRNRVESLGLLKIDVEGAELKVLKGAMDTLRQFSPDILVEVHPKRLRETGGSAQEVLKLLVQNGYTSQKLADRRENQNEVGLREIGSPSGFSPAGICTLYARYSANRGSK